MTTKTLNPKPQTVKKKESGPMSWGDCALAASSSCQVQVSGLFGFYGFRGVYFLERLIRVEGYRVSYKGFGFYGLGVLQVFIGLEGFIIEFLREAWALRLTVCLGFKV